jgi:hypothetical protein
MERRTRIGVALVLVGLVSFGLALAFPVEPVRVHDTSGSMYANESTAEEMGYPVVAYENLSDRGQKLYVQTLENGGTYRVPAGQGAPDFAYPTDSEVRHAGARVGSDRTSNVEVLIERPAEDGHLPPSDELTRPGPDMNESTQLRYDLLTARTRKPQVGSGAHAPRLLGLVLGIAASTAGGYLLASKG